MTSKIRNISKLILSFSISVVFVYFAFRNINILELLQTLSSVKFYWVIVFFICVSFAHLLRAWRWIYLLAPLKEKISLRNSFAAVNIGFAFNNIIPRGGELVRPFAISKTEKISSTSAFSTVVIERLLDSITFFILVLIAFALSPSAFKELFPVLENYTTLVTYLMIALTLIFIYLIIKLEKLILILRKISNLLSEKISNAINKQIDLLANGAQVTWESDNAKKIIIISFLIWAFYIFEMFIIFYAFENFPKENIVIQTAVILLVASSVAYLLPTPSGIGTYHTFIPFVLTGLYGVDQVTALSYAVFTHGIGYFTTSIFGGYYFLKDKIHLKEVLHQPKQ